MGAIDDLERAGEQDVVSAWRLLADRAAEAANAVALGTYVVGHREAVDGALGLVELRQAQLAAVRRGAARVDARLT